MNLPNIIAALVKAQNNFDSMAYANCFSETAIVFDEGKTHQGRAEIEKWIAKANQSYQTVMKVIRFEEKERTGILTAEISGNFPGIPVVLKYHFKMNGGLIQSLKIAA